MWRAVSAGMRDEERGPAGARAAPAEAAPAEAPLRRPLRLVPARGRRPRASRARRRARSVALAAAGLVAGAAGLGGWRVAAERRSTRGGAAAAPPREFATRRGQQAVVTLADGSLVTLGPESRLRVHASGATRLVELTGEAVFVVRHDAARPFVVRAAQAVTEDLGTTFGVRAYPGDTLVRVVVAEGAVALRAATGLPGTGVRLGAGDVGRLDHAGLVAVSHGNPDADLAWTRGRVAFHDAPLGDVMTELGRRYDVAVHFARPADARRRVTVEMRAGPLGEVLDAVTVPLALVHRREGDLVVVRPAAP
jgi:transmembrane sensor